MLGAHISEGTDQIAADRQVAAALEPGQAEVSHPDVAAAVDQQVAGLDVSVQDAEPVRVLQCVGRLHRQPCRLARRYRAANSGILSRGLVEPIGERVSRDELHGVVMYTPVAADGEDRHDMRMMQGRHDLGLDPEPGELPRFDPGGRRQDLQGHATAERSLLGLVDHSHPAAADLADDPELAQHPILIAAHRDRGSVVNRRKRMQELQGGEDLGEDAPDLRVPPDKVGDVGCLASRQSLEVLVRRLGHQ